MGGGPARAAEISRRLDPRVLKLAAAALSADELHLALWLRDERCVETLTSHGRASAGERWELERFPLTVQVLESGRPVEVLVSAPGADEAEVALLHEEGFRALLMLAVTRHGRVVGLLEAFRRNEIGWSQSEVERSAVICEQLGASVAALVPGSDL